MFFVRFWVESSGDWLFPLVRAALEAENGRFWQNMSGRLMTFTIPNGGVLVLWWVVDSKIS